MADLFDDYNCRKKITLNHAGASSGYQKKIVLVRGTGEDVEGANPTIYLENEPLAWPNDIRFTAADGVTLLDFCREENDAIDGTWWVEYDQADGDIDVYVYTGKVDDTDASSGADVFAFYDSFANLDAWTITSGDCTTDGDILTVSRVDDTDAILLCNTAFGADTVMRARVQSAHYNTTSYVEGACYYNTSSYQLRSNFCHNASANNAKHQTSSSTHTFGAMAGWSAGAYHILEMQRNSTTSAIFTVDDSNAVEISTTVPTNNLAPRFLASTSNDSELLVDWVLIRNYLATEPTATVGDMEYPLAAGNPKLLMLLGGGS